MLMDTSLRRLKKQSREGRKEGKGKGKGREEKEKHEQSIKKKEGKERISV